MDLINRQAAIDSLNDEYHGMISDESMKIYQIVKWLNTLPSAQRTGRWIWDDEGFHCSECFYHAYNALGEIMTGEYKFCPNCGCAMKGEDE